MLVFFSINEFDEAAFKDWPPAKFSYSPHPTSSLIISTGGLCFLEIEQMLASVLILRCCHGFAQSDLLSVETSRLTL
jgi:hypothetical protein